MPLWSLPSIHSCDSKAAGCNHVLWDNLKSVMWLELTSPWEDNLTESYIRKKSSCNKLESECRSKGWSVIPLYVKPAALRHVNTTWGMMSKAMGMKMVESKRLRLKCSKIALHCSYHIHQCCSSNIIGISSK